MARGRPCLPNLLIIGARKAGTTSLHSYLSLHPQIFMSKEKELSFFDAKNRWQRGTEWYKTNFDSSFAINGESSPQYSRFPRTPGVPERIKQVLGTPKLIYMVRDPVERIVSDYVQIVDWRPSTGSFADVLADIENNSEEYLQGSSYFLQITQYLKCFPRESLLVVLQERLRKERRKTLSEIFRFLGVDEHFWSDDFDRELNPAENKFFVAPWFDKLAPEALKSELHRPTWLPWTINRLVHRAARIGGKPIEKPKLSMKDDLRLQQALRSDVECLREFLRDPLPEWRSYA